MVTSSLFFIALVGLMYSSDFDTAIKNLKTPFLIFPLIFFTINPLNKKDIQKLLDLFSIATILAALLGLGKAMWFSYNKLGDYFYYLDFAKVLDKHTTYFALFVCISIINLAYGLSVKTSNNRKWYKIIPIIFLLVILYFLSVKVSLIYLISVVFLLIVRAFFKKTGTVKQRLLGILFLFILPAIFLTPNFKERIYKEKASNISERIQLWSAVWDNYLKKNLIIGAGTGDGHQGLVENYLEVGYTVAAKYKYNAHNQYLEQLLFHGILGLILLIALLFYTFFVLYTKDELMLLLIYFSFTVFMFSESILERHSGIILFSFLTSLFLSYSNSKMNLHAKN